MTRWHQYRRRLIRRSLKIPAPLYVLTREDLASGIDPGWV